MDDGHPIIRIVIFIILLLIDAAFTGTEVAVSAVNESVLTKKKEEGDSRAARILRFVGQPAAFMSTIDLIGAAVTIIAGAFPKTLQHLQLPRSKNPHRDTSEF